MAIRNYSQPKHLRMPLLSQREIVSLKANGIMPEKKQLLKKKPRKPVIIYRKPVITFEYRKMLVLD